MTILDHPRTDATADHHGDGGALSSAVVLGATRGALAALCSWLLIVAIAFGVWASAAAHGAATTALLGGTVAWLVGHFGSLTSGAGAVTFTPLLLPAISIASVAWWVRRLDADLEQDRSARVRLLAGVRRDSAVMLAAFAVTYAALVAAAFALTTAAAIHTTGVTVAGGTLLVLLVGIITGLRGRLTEATFTPTAHDRVRDLVPAVIRRTASLWLVGCGVLLLAGLVPALGAFAAHVGRVSAVTGQIAPGVFGGIMLAIVQGAALPNLATWGLAWAAGPGFQVGSASQFSWTQARSDLLPRIPVLGALPDNAAVSPVLMVAVLLPIIAGYVIAVLALRRVSSLSTITTKAMAVASAALGSVVVTTLVMLLGAGSLGGKSLAVVGPHAWLTALALLVEVGLGAAIALAISWRKYHR